MDDLLKRALLYDFYGELLTDRQKEIYEQYVIEDMSLREIADYLKISRQGVHDQIKRSNKILQDYEDKLHLVEKFLAIRNKAELISQTAEAFDGQDAKKFTKEIQRISNEIIEEL